MNADEGREDWLRKDAKTAARLERPPEYFPGNSPIPPDMPMNSVKRVKTGARQRLHPQRRRQAGLGQRTDEIHQRPRCQ